MDSSCKIAVTVVVYNKSCEESATCQALTALRHTSVAVLIYDNSVRDFGNASYCEKQGWIYFSQGKNVGISKAYNACIWYLKENTAADYLCLFDDDTAINESYFDALNSAINDSGADIYVPLVFSAGRLLSPCKIKPNFSVSMFKDEQEALLYNGRDITAINSGMAIKLNVFDNYCYDEHIFLDGVDHNFMRDMNIQKKIIKIFPYQCIHEFSGDSKPSMQSALTRFQIFARDNRYILRNNCISYFFIAGKRAVKLTILYHSMSFLRTFFRVSSFKEFRGEAYERKND